METDYLTSLPSADLGGDRQVLGTSVEPLNSYMPMGKMQYDTTVRLFDQFEQYGQFDQLCGESLLAECMPQLADVMSAGFLPFDSSLPANLFSDGEESSEEETVSLTTNSVSTSTFPTSTFTPTLIPSTAITTTTPTASTLMPNPEFLQSDALDQAAFDITNYVLPKSTQPPEPVPIPTTTTAAATAQLDPMNSENLFSLPEDFKISESDFACLGLDAIGSALFENGIDAQDMSSLLEQFEKASATLPDPEEDESLPKSPKKEVKIILKTEPAKPVSTKPPVTPSPAESEVMRLLTTETPSIPNTKPARRGSQSSTSSSSSSSSSSTSSSKSSKTPHQRIHKYPHVASKPISMHQRPPSLRISSSSSKSSSHSSIITNNSSKSKSSKSQSKSSSKSSSSSSTSTAKQKQSVKTRSHSSSSRSSSSLSRSSSSSSLTSKSSSFLGTSSESSSKINSRSSRGSKSKPSSPPPEIIEKIKASTKRKSSIMLPSVIPSRSQRGHAVNMPAGPRQKRQDPKLSTSLHKQLTVNTKGLNKSSSASAPCSPALRTKAPATATYSAPVSPVQNLPGTSSSKPTSIRTPPSDTNITVKAEPFEVSSNYFDLIVDHDYCQNSRKHQLPNKGSKSSAVSRKNMGTSDSLETNPEQDGSVLKSLLLNKNLAEELKRQAAEQRKACVKRKVSVNLDVVDMDIDEPESRFSKFVGERTDLCTDGAGIAVGLPLPPLPPLDQLPKDHEIRSKTTESVRPANDMNFILNEAKRLMERGQKKGAATNLDDKNSDSNESVNSTQMSDLIKKARRVIKSEGPAGNSPDSNDSLQSASEMSHFLNKAKRMVKSKQSKPRELQQVEEKSSDSNDSLKSAADMKSFLNSATIGSVTRNSPKEEPTQSDAKTAPEVKTAPPPKTAFQTKMAADFAAAFGFTNNANKISKMKRIPKLKHPTHPKTPEENLFDKLPNYFTALKQPPKQDKVKMENARHMYTSVPTHDRDPSPERNPGFNKLPTYYCFTNSTKYDNSSSPATTETTKSLSNTETTSQTVDVSRETSTKLSNEMSNDELSSRSPTPGLMIVSRANSESRSKPASRVPSPARSRSRSHSRSSSTSSKSRSSSCKSRSASSERSTSPVKTLQQRGRAARKRTFRRKRHSYSSSQSSSCSRSRSRSRSRLRSPKGRGHSSWSRSRSRSRSYSRSRSRSDSRSRSRSYSRSRSRSRDYRRRGDRVRRDFSSRREEDRVLEGQDKRKQIEERRIVYVGCIPSNFTKRDLRRQFECFGEIEDVSVHFREHGGDNYGFVTFAYPCDAFSAIEKGKTIPSMSRYDLCFGGRREFCKTEYADLDGDMEMEEEMSAVTGRSSGPVDFDELLRQAQVKIKKKAKEGVKTTSH